MRKLKSKNIFFRLIILITFFLNANYANSDVISYWEIPPGEKAMLPPFCTHGYAKYKIKGSVYMNHLCPGLYALNHAQRIFENNKTKQYALQAAEDHLSYTISHVRDFPFRSTVFVKLGTVYEMQGNMSKAIEHYYEAIKIQSGNVYAYRALADAYWKMGNKVQANKIIDEGIKIKPKSRLLLSIKKRIKK